MSIANLLPGNPADKPLDYMQLVEYPCFTALPKLDETPLEFRVDRSDSLIDLNRMYLEIEVSIVNEDGSDVESEYDADAGKYTKGFVAPVNNFAYAMFKNVELMINNRVITTSENTYPWWTYLVQLLYYDPNEKKVDLAEIGWVEDEAGMMDLIDPSTNKPLKERFSEYNDSSKVRIIMPVMVNRQVHGWLPPFTDVTLRFHPGPPALCLMSKDTDAYRIKVWDAKLQVARLRMPSVPKNLHYRVSSVTMRTKTVSKGDQNVEWIPFEGPLPKRIFFFQIDHDAYNGKQDQNPYNLEPKSMSRFQLFKNGVSLPFHQGFNQCTENDYKRLYHWTAKAINSPRTFTVKHFDYTFGYFMIAIDLTRDWTADEVRAADFGTLRIAIDYKKALSDSLTLFCVGEFDESITIEPSLWRIY